jgi:protein-S-isoprenylcysteine O-methyltransferase Ste14
MYLSVLTVLVGESVLFGSLRIAIWTVVVAITVHLFVVVYEEPTLRRLFGAEFEAYCRSTPRWIPRGH